MHREKKYLSAADLGSSSILHEVVNGHAAHAPQPGLQILHPHSTVRAQRRLCSRALHPAHFGVVSQLEATWRCKS